MARQHTMTAVVGGVGVAALIVAVTHAGPLDPPAGPVAPTYKTLAEVEPRVAVQSLPGSAEALHVITQPGSYYFTGHIQGVADKHGIRVLADDVTIDLMGFSLMGNPGPTGLPLGGVHAVTSVKNLVVQNGTIRKWSDGVSAQLASSARIEKLHTSWNSSSGIEVGVGSRVSACVSESDHHGILVGSQSVVTSCVVRDCSGVGIACFTTPAVVTDCVVYGANGNGIVCGHDSIVSRCRVDLSNLNGIVVGALGVGGQVRDCMSEGNGQVGILVETGSLVIGCTARSNGSSGIVASASTISGCHVELNAFDGIGVVSDSLVTGNNCRANGQAPTSHSGIYASGSDNRIEGNNLTDNEYGVYTDAPGNLVIRNSASGNPLGGYSFAGGTVAGPIVTAATIATNTNPHANYDF